MGCCKSTQYGCCIAIDHDESIILNKPTGRELRHGPGWFCFPVWWDAQVLKTIALHNNQYIIVKHIIDPDGKHTSPNRSEKDELLNDSEMQLIEIIRGPQIYHMRNPYDRISEVQTMLNLSSTQFIIITDKLTGSKRVERGPQMFCPKPFDEVGEIKNMYNLSSTEYIVITDESTGEKYAVTGMPCSSDTCGEITRF